MSNPKNKVFLNIADPDKTYIMPANSLREIFCDWCRIIVHCKKVHRTDCILRHHSKLFHLSAHLVNHLIVENRKAIPKFLSGKRTFQKRNPPDFKLYPSKLNNKNFPPMV